MLNSSLNELYDTAKLYTGSVINTAGVASKWNQVASVTLPAGLYIVTWKVRFDTLGLSSTGITIWASLGNTGNVDNSGNDIGGNYNNSITGIEVTEVVSLSATTTIYGQLWPQSVTYTSANNNGCKLRALKVG